ncbi:hypothetical protein Taro_021585, partial [Colocasia esculenta]|nr:hypothetical protein [Colocasia esculenta]
DNMISDSTHSRYIAMQMYIDNVLSQVQRTDSSTSDAGPSESCTGSSQQPGASQMLTDEVMPNEITHLLPQMQDLLSHAQDPHISQVMQDYLSFL